MGAVDIRQLEMFLAVVECGSVTKAAIKMGLTTGAVSLQMQGLAAHLRTELFIRAGKRLAPTPAAMRLADLATVAVRQMRVIEQEFNTHPAGDTRPFHFATGPTTLIHRLGRPLRMLRKKFPEAEIKVTVSATEEMVAGLLSRRYDLALLSLPVENELLKLVPLFQEELLVLTPSHDKVSGWHVGNIEASELANVPFLLYPEHSNMRKKIDGFFHELNINPNVIMEAEDTEAIKRLVESGFGYSMLPEFALRGQPRFFHVCRIAKQRLVRQQALAMVHSDHPRALTDSIANFLLEALGDKA